MQLQDLLLPEDFLQLDNLKVSIEITSGTSFFSIIGCDTDILQEQLSNYLEDNIVNSHKYKVNSNKILTELIGFENKEKFIIINMFDIKDDEYLKNLLFYRDLISDNKLKIILIVNNASYKYILKNAIDLYNINSFAYLFNTHKVEILENKDTNELDNLLKEYRDKKMTLNKKQKISYLYDIALLYDEHDNVSNALKYFNEALILATKLKWVEKQVDIKFSLSNLYRKISKPKLALKYMLECKKFSLKNYLTQYLDVLQCLAQIYIELFEYDMALKYTDELYNASLEYNDKEKKLNALERYSIIYKQLNDETRMRDYIEKTIKLAKNLDNYAILGTMEQLKVFDYRSKNDYKSALIHLNNAIAYYKKDNRMHMVYNMYILSAEVYSKLNDYNKSNIYCQWSYIHNKNNNMFQSLVSILQVMAHNYTFLNQIDKSLEKLEEALTISKKLKLVNDQIEIYLSISNNYDFKKEYNSSLKSIDNAYKLAKNKLDYNLSSIYFKYSETNNLLNNIKLAYEYYEKAKELYDIKNIVENMNAIILYGEILANDNQLEKAILYFSDALKLSNKIDNLSGTINIEINLAYAYKKLNNKKLSQRYFNEVLNKLEILNTQDSRITKLKKELSN